MSVTVAIRFPLGRYHANPWDRSVNEGAVEWPPSPWRLLRTLVSTWYTRWPDLPAPVLDGLLEALGGPPAYWTPAATPGHTRHYLPGAGHRKGETGGTELTLDPYLWVSREEPLLVRWEAELSGEQRQTLAKLVEQVPYLGRAESVCEARLVGPDEETEPGEGWWRPGSGGDETIRLLAPSPPVRRALLELGTVQLRRQRRTVPPDTRWVTYTRTMPEAPVAAAASGATVEVTAIRFAVVSKAPLLAANGVLLADEVHRIATRALDGGRAEALGHGGAATHHQHAHWIPLADRHSNAHVQSLVVWAPVGFTQQEVGRIVADRRLRGISGQRSGNGYEVKGLPPVDLLLQAAGPIRTVAPELCGPARRWRSLTPYLPVRHHKPRRETLAEYLTQDVNTELRYRGHPQAMVGPDEDLPEGWALGYRRYRLKGEHLGHARRGYGLRLELDADPAEPLLLGQLSHFGYGIFVPDRTG